MATCNICRAEYNWGDNPCWRCGEDNGYWEERRKLPMVERALDFFRNTWGGIAIVPLVIPLIGLAYNGGYSIITWSFNSEQRAALLQHGLALFLSIIAISFVYTMRFELWNYSWIRNIRWKKTPPVNIMGILLLLLGVVALLIWLSILMFYNRGESRSITVGFDFPGFFDRIIVPTLYSLVFAGFTAGSMMMSAGLYIARLNEHVGQPIYMNTNLLTDVVKKAVLDNLKASFVLRVANLERTSSGGLRVVVNQIKELPPAPTSINPASGSSTPGQAALQSQEPTELVEKRYEVLANEWGQVLVLRERSLERPLDGKW